MTHVGYEVGLGIDCLHQALVDHFPLPDVGTRSAFPSLGGEIRQTNKQASKQTGKAKQPEGRLRSVQIVQQ